MIGVEITDVLRVVLWLLLRRTDGGLNFPAGRDGYGHADGASVPSTEERAHTLQYATVAGDFHLQVAHVLVGLVLSLAQVVTLFSEVSAVFFQLRDVLLLLVIVLLLGLEVRLQVSGQLLLTVLNLFCQLGVGLHRVELCLFGLGFCRLGFRFGFLPLVSPGEESPATTTEQDAQQGHDVVD